MSPADHDERREGKDRRKHSLASEDHSHPWHTMTPDEVEELLETGKEGLEASEVEERLRSWGANEIEMERRTPLWRMFLRQFNDPLIYILLVAALVMLILREFIDFGVIAAVVLLNALIGFIQERRAERDMQALARLSAQKATVVRGGKETRIPARELVPGDLVVLESGSRVPADLRLVKSSDFEIDESALTGESVPSAKTSRSLDAENLVAADQINLAFSGTVVTRGRGRGYVIRTGGATEFGQIAAAIRRVGRTSTPLQESLNRFGRNVGFVILALTAGIAVVGVLEGRPPGEIFAISVALAVASIPEGLPVVLTLTFAIGVRRMARRNAIIRSLPAVETLGSTSAIGSDKTGTLTRNEMTVRAIWAGGERWDVTGGGYDPEGEVVAPDSGETAREALSRTLEAGVLANELSPPAAGEEEEVGDPTEIALHVVARKGGIDPVELRREAEEADLLPFESELRLMASLRRTGPSSTVYVKGAPEEVARRCDRMITADGVVPMDGASVEEAARQLAGEGYRVLGFATGESDGAKLSVDTLGGLTFCGLQAMEDPLRPEALDAVRDARESGIRVLMLTGDHVDTARAIASQLGLGESVVAGASLQTMSVEEIELAVRQTNVFARVAPEHKLRIVEALKRDGHVVAVTGDGVNDAPALRAAHLGIAMGRKGTDVAREAAEMVLADDDFATITAAIEEGRIVFSNIRKVTFFLLSTAVGQVLAILVALLLSWPLPFLAAQILWINLVTNGLQDVALAFEPGEPGLRRRKPRPRSEGVLTRRLLERLGAVGIVIAAGTLFSFWWSLEQTGDIVLARTVAMTQMVVFQFFHVFNSRSLDRSILQIPLLSNRFLFISVIAAFAAHLSVLYLSPLQYVFRTVPLDLSTWLMLAAVGATVVVGGELDKWWNRRRGRPVG
jgi:magnesium-transporting ATPase (P-type)